jgi:hypothetical protein
VEHVVLKRQPGGLKETVLLLGRSGTSLYGYFFRNWTLVMVESMVCAMDGIDEHGRAFVVVGFLYIEHGASGTDTHAYAIWKA